MLSYGLAIVLVASRQLVFLVMKNWFTAIATLAACHSPTSPTILDAAATATSSQAIPTTPVASTSTSAAVYARASACPQATTALATARRFTLDKNYPAASDAFDDAIRAKPADAHIRAERGYAKFLAGDITAAKNDWLTALTLTKDESLIAQIDFNFGETFEKTGDAEAARVAFAAAERHGSTVAKARLGSRSHCPVSWKVGGDTAHLAHGWGALAAGRSCLASKDTTRAPRARACVSCANPTRDLCTGSAWIIDDDFSLGRVQSLVVAPLGSDWFIYEFQIGDTNALDVHVKDGLASWREVTSTDSVLGEYHGSQLDVPGTSTVLTSEDRWSDEPAGSTCKPDLTADVHLDRFERTNAVMNGDLNFAVTHWYALATGRAVFTMTVYAGDVTATVESHIVHITGIGCDETIAIP